MDSRKRKRSSSGSPEPAGGRPTRRVKSSGFSNFSDKPPEEIKPKMSTQEILEYYKKFNPSQSLTNHNKAERQLYIGNIPLNLNDRELMELLNGACKELGKDVGIFQDDPVVGVWISGDQHYAFVDFKTAEDATQAFALQQVSIHGNYLKVGRPKNATGPIPHPSQLLCGNPNGPMVQHSTGMNKKKTNFGRCKILLFDPIRLVMGGDGGALTALNTKLLVTNFPSTYAKEQISSICEVFGKVKQLDLIKDPQTGEFKGHVHVEYADEVEAKKAHAGMMGFKIGEALLFVKRLTTIANPTAGMEGEMFKALLDDQPTPCLSLRGLVLKEELAKNEDYKELEESVMEELTRHGACLRVHCPRPPLFGEAESVPGYGKVYARFQNEIDSEKAKIALYRRRMNGRPVEAMYYPLEKFLRSQFD